MMARQWRNVSVSVELVRWESPLECASITAEGVAISWQSGTGMCVCVCKYTHVTSISVGVPTYVSVSICDIVGVGFRDKNMNKYD